MCGSDEKPPLPVPVHLPLTAQLLLHEPRASNAFQIESARPASGICGEGSIAATEGPVSCWRYSTSSGAISGTFANGSVCGFSPIKCGGRSNRGGQMPSARYGDEPVLI